VVSVDSGGTTRCKGLFGTAGSSDGVGPVLAPGSLPAEFLAVSEGFYGGICHLPVGVRTLIVEARIGAGFAALFRRDGAGEQRRGDLSGMAFVAAENIKVCAEPLLAEKVAGDGEDSQRTQASYDGVNGFVNEEGCGPSAMSTLHRQSRVRYRRATRVRHCMRNCPIRVGCAEEKEGS